MPIDEEAGQVQIRTFDGKKKSKPIEEILIMASNLLIVACVVIMIMRTIAQQEIRKAKPTQRQQDMIYDLAGSAFTGHEWRVRQIAQMEAWRAIDEMQQKQRDTEAEKIEEAPQKH